MSENSLTGGLSLPKSDVIVVPEPEIQYASSRSLHAKVRDWLNGHGAALEKQSRDIAAYWDTKNLRLFREGAEYRVKGDRHEIKLPGDPSTTRVIVPDEHGIVYRDELKLKRSKDSPALRLFFGQSALDPIAERVKRFFEKPLEEQFIGDFTKEKYYRTIKVGKKEGVIEYSLQRGHIQDARNPENRTDEMFIIELELRKGSRKALLAAKKEFEEIWGQDGLKILERTKVQQGFALIFGRLSEKAQENFSETMDRVRVARQAVLALQAA